MKRNLHIHRYRFLKNRPGIVGIVVHSNQIELKRTQIAIGVEC